MKKTESLIDENARLEKELARIQRPARDTFGRNFIPIIVIIMTVMAFFTVIAMLLIEIPPANQDIVYLSVGLVLGAFANAIGYIFGKPSDTSDPQPNP